MDRQRLLFLFSLTVGFCVSVQIGNCQVYQTYEGQIISEYEIPSSTVFVDQEIVEPYVVIQQEEVDWVRDYQQARKLATESSRPVLLFITSESCHYCEMMRRDVYSDPRIVGLLKRSFVAAKLNLDPKGELAKELKITLFPTTVIIDEDGNVLDYARGYRKTDEIHERIASAVSQQTRIARK